MEAEKRGYTMIEKRVKVGLQLFYLHGIISLLQETEE